MIYRFHPFLLDTREYTLTCNSEKIALEPRVFDVLVYLLKNRVRIVTKDELIESLWGGRIITDSALNTCIRSVRRALSDDREKQMFIRTFPKRGFQFVGLVEADVPSESIDEYTDAKIFGLQKNKFLVGGILIAIVIAFMLILVFQPADENYPSDRPSIAVLDFEHSFNNDTQRYFTEGLLEELVSSLSRYRELFVIARNSSTLYKDNEVNIKEIGKALGVDYIVDGRV